MVSWRQSCVLIGVICAVSSITCATRVSTVTCTNGDSDCSTIGHAVCGSSGNCECSTGYAEDLTDGSTCVPTVSSIACTDSGNECDSVQNAECDVGAKKCKCSDGYVMNANLCAAENAEAKVSAVTCTNGGSECNPIDHSACGSSGKCECSAGYAEDLTDGRTCVQTVSSIACTDSGNECDSVQNAECDVGAKKCKCSDGYVMNANLCAAENGAAKIRMGAGTLLLFVILTILQKVLTG